MHSSNAVHAQKMPHFHLHPLQRLTIATNTRATEQKQSIGSR